MSWVLNAGIKKDGPFRTLMALANHADQWGECWPSVGLLLHYRQCSRATLYSDLKWLEEQGFIARSTGLTRASGGGALKGKSQVLYRLLMPEVLPQAPVQERIARPDRFIERLKVEDECPSGDQCPDSRTLVESEGESPSEGQCPDSRTLVDERSQRCPDSRTGPVQVFGLPPTPLYKEEPSLEPPNQTPQAPHAGFDEDAAMVGSGRVGDLLDESARSGVGVDDVAPEPDTGAEPSGEARRPELGAQEPLERCVEALGVSGCGIARPDDSEPSEACSGASGVDWGLVRSCLPDEMQALDGPGVARVADALRQRVEAGWSHRLLREILAGNALPPQVRNLTGLVLHRLSQIPVDQAPVDRQSVSARFAAQDRDQGRSSVRPAWMLARREAIEAGLPEGRRSVLWWASHFDQERGVLVLDDEVEAAEGAVS